jgi:plastocyanin
MRRIPRLALTAAILLSGIALLTSCGGSSKSNPAGPGGAADVTINIIANNSTNSYAPSPDTVSVGQTVAWHNSDAITHTGTGTGFDTGGVGPGSTSRAFAMNTQGTFVYHCTIHPGMTGTLVVK